jgi:hypothetical protein
MSELTKKERQAIIDRWLNDEEDDEYEVVPMKTRKGKFIVRHRSKTGGSQPTRESEAFTSKRESEEGENEDTQNEVEQIPSTERGSEHTGSSIEVEDRSDMNEHTRIPAIGCASSVAKSQKYINDLRSTRIKDSKTKSRNKRNELTVLPEILEHLKILGDDIKRRQQKKDIKHEIKHIHLKDKIQNTVIQPTYETQIDILPRYVRPKLDLNLVTLCSRYH